MTMSSEAEERRRTIIDTVRDFGKRLFFFIRGRVDSDEDAEDILQDVWYSFSQVMTREPIQQTSAWLYRVAKNRIIDKRRKKKEDSLDDLFADFLTDSTTPESQHMQNRFWEELFKAMEEIPEEQRSVFTLNELEDVPFSEIAERTGESINTLISRKRYAVLYLRKRLEVLYKEIIQH